MSDRSDCDDIDDDVTLPRPSDESSAAAAAAAAGETFALPKLPEELNNPPFTPSEARPWDVQVMVYNVAKRQNIGNMVRSAVAFGASAIIVVGNRHINTFGNKNTNNYIRFAHYDKLDDAVAALRARDYDIVGVEIGNGAKRLNDLPFRKSTCFMFGQEGSGLSPRQMAACDYLTYIPQYGAGTASLNVSNAAAIILHRFADWAGYQEQAVEGAKFIVDDSRLVKVSKRPAEGQQYERSEQEQFVRAQRQARRQQQEAAAAAAAVKTDAAAEATVAAAAAAADA